MKHLIGFQLKLLLKHERFYVSCFNVSLLTDFLLSNDSRKTSLVQVDSDTRKVREESQRARVVIERKEIEEEKFY